VKPAKSVPHLVSRPAWLIVTEPQAIRCLLNPAQRQLLVPFLIRPETIKGVADWAGLPLDRVYRHVKTFEKLGLLRLARLQARPGRAVQYYECTASGFFVPFSDSSAEDLNAFASDQVMPMFAHLQSLLACAWQDLVRDPNDTGFRLFVRDGVVGMDFSPQGPDVDVEAAFLHPSGPPLLCDVQPLRLSRTDAKSLQHDLHELLESYRGNFKVRIREDPMPLRCERKLTESRHYQ
jgi:hypothetical protein